MINENCQRDGNEFGGYIHNCYGFYKKKKYLTQKVVLEYNDFKKKEEARRAVRNTLFGVVGRAQNKKNELKEEYE